MTKTDFLKDWNSINNLKLFEFEVLNLITDEIDYLVFDIEISGSYFTSTHVALNVKQDKSNKVATTKTKIDFNFSLDVNLQSHYEDCLNDIINSEFYKLTEE